MEQPHVNVLSKVDLIEKYSKLPFNLDFFTEVLDLSYLLQHFSVSDCTFLFTVVTSLSHRFCVCDISIFGRHLNGSCNKLIFDTSRCITTHDCYFCQLGLSAFAHKRAVFRKIIVSPPTIE